MEKRLNPSFVSFLDISRALASLVVLSTHLRDPLFQGWPELPENQQNLFVKAWFFLTGFGFEAVIIFFVLSGFLVGGFGIEKLKNERWSSNGYFIDRISRLFVVLVPALVLTLCFDHLGNMLFGYTGLWDGTNLNFSEKLNVAIIDKSTGPLLACNLAMLQSFYCGVLGSNIPLWSLSYEFWFYVVFGVAIIAWQAKGIKTVALAVAIIAMVFLLGISFIWFLIIWLCGVGAFLYHGARFRWPVVSLSIWFVLATVSRLNLVGTPGELSRNLIVVAQGVAFAWVLVSFRDKNYKLLLRISRFGKHLASFSYSLYLIHFPIVLFLIGLATWLLNLDISYGVPPATILGVGLYGSIFSAVIIISWVFSRFTESNTHHLRGWIRRKLATRNLLKSQE